MHHKFLKKVNGGDCVSVAEQPFTFSSMLKFYVM